jgi:hypothetical protein
MFKRRQPPGDATAALAAAPVPPQPAPAVASELPEPPPGARHLVFLVLDSLRFDSWVEAAPPTGSRLGEVERRWSYASWTAPSHYNLLMGLLPHSSPTHVHASELYKAEYLRYAERLGVEGVEFKTLLPSLFLPTYLRRGLGYRTRAFVSMPVLNARTPINRDFDDYELMSRHNDLDGILDRLDFSGDRPTFHLINTGETHYPYALADDDPSEWPRLSGVHGVVKRLDEAVAEKDDGAPAFFDEETLAELRRRQVRAVAGLDPLLERLFDEVPRNTWVVVTSDHGELFGEDGYFGHGPIAHEKVFEVPFVEGLVR